MERGIEDGRWRMEVRSADGHVRVFRRLAPRAPRTLAFGLINLRTKTSAFLHETAVSGTMPCK